MLEVDKGKGRGLRGRGNETTLGDSRDEAIRLEIRGLGWKRRNAPSDGIRILADNNRLVSEEAEHR
jgi:hypothetical protein